jgi:PAS domain-containing protein
MRAGASAATSESEQAANKAGGQGVSLVWNVLAPGVLVLAVGIELAARLREGRFSYLEGAFELVILVIAVRLCFLRTAKPGSSAEAHRQIFDSTGPMVLAIGLDGSITHMNPAAERMLGYHAEELVGKLRTAEILALDEGPRLIGALQRLSGIEPDPEMSPMERLTTLMGAVRNLPPSQVPSFEAQFKRKDGTTFPVGLHISALRDEQGAMQGLVVMALDVSATMRQEQATRESQERYRDLFENSSEMIATLSTAGRFLYANPADAGWRDDRPVAAAEPHPGWAGAGVRVELEPAPEGGQSAGGSVPAAGCDPTETARAQAGIATGG